MVTQTSAHAVRFRVYMPEASRVDVVGTFTDWRERAVAMTRDGEGWWSAELTLDTGDHEFQYLVDGLHWLADYAAGGLRMNRYGTWVSLLHVPMDEAESLAFTPPETQAPMRVAA